MWLTDALGHLGPSHTHRRSAPSARTGKLQKPAPSVTLASESSTQTATTLLPNNKQACGGTACLVSWASALQLSKSLGSRAGGHDRPLTCAAGSADNHRRTAAVRLSGTGGVGRQRPVVATAGGRRPCARGAGPLKSHASLLPERAADAGVATQDRRFPSHSLSDPARRA